MRAPSPRSSLLVYAGLMLLLGVTVLSWQLGGGVALGLAFAVAKAGLIAAFYMHLDRTSPMQRLFASVGLVWLAILIVLTLGDYATR